MKKTALFFILVLVSISLSAQKGNWFAGGAISFSTITSKSTSIDPEFQQRTTKDKASGWEFSPEVGTYLKNNMQVGLGLSVGKKKVITASDFHDDYQLKQYGIKTFYRYFWGKENLKPFVGITGFYSYGNDVSPYSSGGLIGSGTIYYYTIDVSTIGLSTSLGFRYSLAKRLDVLGYFGVLGYSRSVTKKKSEGRYDPNKQITNTFGFEASSIGNRFNIGFYYTFKPKKLI